MEFHRAKVAVSCNSFGLLANWPPVALAAQYAVIHFSFMRQASFDWVVRGGSVLDGTGTSAFSADIGVKDGRICEIGRIGRVSGRGVREFDADGALVTPGFVDIHTHYDGVVTWGERLMPSSHHGVTTVIMGNCGVGFAPCRAEDHELLIELMEGVEDIPEPVLSAGLPWEWESFEDYLDFVSARNTDMDFGAQLPHGALRVFVMGHRGADGEPASPEDISEMRALTKSAIQAGAIGVTTSRTLNHRSSRGAPTPSLKAERDELVGLGLGLKDAGAGVFQVVSDFKDLDEEFGILAAVARESGRPLSISLAQGISAWGNRATNYWRRILERIGDANREGMTIRAQVAPRAIGITLGLDVTMQPFMLTQACKSIAHLALAARVSQMSHPDFRRRVLAEATGAVEHPLQTFIGNLERVWELENPPDYEPSPSASIASRARKLGKAPEDLMYDLLVADGGTKLFYSPFANYAEDCLDCCREMILDEHCVMGLSDGGAHVSTICDASFATFLFAHWGRDRSRGELIDLPQLVKSQTRDTAEAVGLQDRGVLAEGYKADINVIDFDALRVLKPEVVFDLPGGGRRLEQRADGYLATFVSGEMTYEKGEGTGALPGCLIRL